MSTARIRSQSMLHTARRDVASDVRGASLSSSPQSCSITASIHTCNLPSDQPITIQQFFTSSNVLSWYLILALHHSESLQYGYTATAIRILFGIAIGATYCSGGAGAGGKILFQWQSGLVQTLCNTQLMQQNCCEKEVWNSSRVLNDLPVVCTVLKCTWLEAHCTVGGKSVSFGSSHW